jgi:poly(3-hydroxybutyrate) depolymerase
MSVAALFHVRTAAAVLAALAAPAVGPILSTPGSGPHASARPAPSPHTRTLTIHYRAYNGRIRPASVLLPAWYGPRNDPPIPLVISPHGRGVGGRTNAHLWRDLPGIGGFAVVNPAGEGRKLRLFSWGYAGQIADLARMAAIVHAQLPWLRVDQSRIYAVGGSMGGQETLLLVARYPHLLAGAVAVDSVTDFALQYRNFPRLKCDDVCVRNWNGPLALRLQHFARMEIGGSPRTAPAAYAARSPLDFAAAIARSCVPLQIWWSAADQVVVDSDRQSGTLFRRVRELNVHAPVAAYRGYWIHSVALDARRRLPLMLVGLGLLPSDAGHRRHALHYIPAADGRDDCLRAEAAG